MKTTGSFPLNFILVHNGHISDFSASVCMLQKVSTFYLVVELAINGGKKQLKLHNLFPFIGSKPLGDGESLLPLPWDQIHASGDSLWRWVCTRILLLETGKRSKRI